MPFNKVNPRQNFPELESEILKFWESNDIFKKSVESKNIENTFSFFDGPPFATGLPHYGHILAGTIKDVIPRFKTMQGFRVDRVWGWDTHGLPIENIVEQELDFKSKLQVEEYGVDNFNEKCRTKVLAYADEWKKIVAKTGRWVDMENAYLTLEPQFMESVWWVFKNLWDKELIYKGHKVMPYCPRCSTGLSNFEVGQAYVDKRDKAATVRFQSTEDKNTYFLAWTTTPWTLPGNLALTVNNDIEYVKVEKDGNFYILAKERLEHYQAELGNKIVGKYKGRELIGKKYLPIFDYYKNSKKAFEVIAGEFVTTDDGTGIVHTAPAFGEEDYKVSKENGIDFFMPVDDLGQFTIEVPEYAGSSVVTLETNEKILHDLGEKVIKIEDISHSYPHCWRCDTPLIYKAIDSYSVAVSKIKNEILQNNSKIAWMPQTIGKNRFAKLIESAPDWNISRNRFWGTPLPVWVCHECKKLHVFGSISEIEEASKKKIIDLHLHFMEKIEISCNCGGKAKLSGEVLDCWFESGSMPYGSFHYPFENKERFEKEFPANFIAEGIDQTRGWFYSLLVLSTALFGKTSYENVVVNGTVLAEDGQKMSKRLQNYPDPTEVMEKYGADAMRFYLMSSPAVKAGDLNFSEKGVEEVVKSLILRLWNSYSFFVTYANLDGFDPTGKVVAENVLDSWMFSVTNQLIEDVTKAMEKYDLSLASRYLNNFIEELSNWYIRRSRKRFWKSENDGDKLQAYETLHFVLVTYTKLLAPIMPFVTDEIYKNLTGEESVHLSDWPIVDKSMIDVNIEKSMKITRDIIEKGLAERSSAGIKVRQPLSQLLVKGHELIADSLISIIKEEVNVKEVKFTQNEEFSVELDTDITLELKAEGNARDFIRFVQEARKKAGFNVEDRIILSWKADESISLGLETWQEYIAKETLALEINSKKEDYEYKQTVKLDGTEVWFGISRK